MKLFQNLINQVREVIDVEFGVMDETGLILGCSDESKIGTTHAGSQNVVASKQNKLVLDGVTFNKVLIKGKLEYITYINSANESSNGYLSLISINLVNIKNYFEEKFDRGSFVKNIILDNILPSDIALRAKELHFSNNTSRVAFLIRSDKNRDIYSHEVVQSLFPSKNKDFVIIIDDENTVLIKELKSNDDYKEIEKTAKAIIDTFNTELMVKAQIGIGTVVDNIRDINRSYREAQTALQIGSIFDSDKAIINYENLGLGRLIYQLPTTLCKLFLNEVFKDDAYESLDDETLLTIQKFFEKDLNVSETSRLLYVHRNTLVYRLDKIQKITGLDLRKFDDAIIFKVSMLVKKYLDKTEKQM